MSNCTEVTYLQQKLSQNEFSLGNYDVIGFDLDHTICKYKLKELYKLIYETLANFLIEKHNYSEKLLDVNAKDITFCQKGLVLDKSRGNFLKLDSRHHIVKASHGTSLLSKEDIKAIYGPDCIWQDSKGIPRKLCWETALQEPFYVFKDYFVTAGALLCAKAIDILDEQNGSPLSSYSVWDHFRDGLIYMYERHNFQDDSGKFFPALKKHPELYIEKCSPDLKDWLVNIRKSKKTFLLTSSNFDSASFLANFCLGDDWANYFDLIIAFARKPFFFRGSNPFYCVEGNEEKHIIKPEEMKPSVTYTQGNWRDLQSVCSQMCGTENPRALYVGDSVVEDVYAPSEFGGCDTVAVVEEMLAERMDGVENLHNAEEELLSDFWGSFFTVNDPCARGHSSTLWASIISQYSRLSVPDLSELISLQLQDRVPSFSREYPTSGYYPGSPKSFQS